MSARERCPAVRRPLPAHPPGHNALGTSRPVGNSCAGRAMTEQSRVEKVNLVGSLPFAAVHVAAVAGVAWVGISVSLVGVAALLYVCRIGAVTLAYHRYFSHRSFKTSRAFQFLLALGAQSSAQKGVLWWAGHHRHHHKYSDMPQDIHSVRRSGLWHSHVGWILGSDWNDTNHAM